MAPRKGAAKRRINNDTSSDDGDNSHDDLKQSTITTKRQPSSYTCEELEAMLKATRPEDFALIPNIDTLTFEPIDVEVKDLRMKSVCGMRLYFGDIESVFPSYRERVHIYLGGKGNNTIKLVSENKKEVILLPDISTIQPIKPFWYLCTHGRILDPAGTARVKALTSYLFLAAGYIKTVQCYNNFEENLKDGIHWYGQGAKVNMEENRSDQTPAQAAMALDVQTEGIDYDPEAAEQVHQGEWGMRIQDCEGAGADSHAPRKKARQDDKISRMRECYEQLGHEIDECEKDTSAKEKEAAAMSELERTISTQQTEMHKQSERIHVMDQTLRGMEATDTMRREEIRKLCFMVADYRQKLINKDMQIKQIDGLRGEEETKRVAAEKELEDRRNAQRHMAAILSTMAK
ncbi:hypothetical protein FB567DRAFT_547679 [Paraphoma chrysanthemicola]|uniref:Uncharacterized protein n=1 Tax=Paraphoma chrysanthemicola TaxID=798071 RepID=A0A8K0W0K4_9PLEO|nr:hypothetical protein FB567DRAFT_547679 [Paraphoma chrysanthemicola]